jgi:hypothetical protein
MSQSKFATYVKQPKVPAFILGLIGFLILGGLIYLGYEANRTAVFPYALESGYTRVKDLRVGDMLYDVKDGKLVQDTIESITKQYGLYTVYNLKLQSSPNTYIAQGLLVHNKGGNCPPWQEFCGSRQSCGHCTMSGGGWCDVEIDCGGTNPCPCGGCDACFDKCCDPPDYRVVGRVLKDGSMEPENSHTITSSDGKTASWAGNPEPYYAIGGWKSGTQLTFTLTDPGAGYTCNWSFGDGSGKVHASGSGCTTGNITIQTCCHGGEWSNHLTWFLAPQCTPVVNAAWVPGTPTPCSILCGVGGTTTTPYICNGISSCGGSPTCTGPAPAPVVASCNAPALCACNGTCDNNNDCATGYCELTLGTCRKPECPYEATCPAPSGTWTGCDPSTPGSWGACTGGTCTSPNSGTKQCISGTCNRTCNGNCGPVPTQPCTPACTTVGSACDVTIGLGSATGTQCRAVGVNSQGLIINRGQVTCP